MTEKHLKIELEGGKVIPLLFGIPACEIYAEQNGLKLSEVLEHIVSKFEVRPTKVAASILLAGANNYTEYHSYTQPYTFKDAVDWVTMLGYNSGVITEAVGLFFKLVSPPSDLTEDAADLDEIDKAKKKEAEV